MSRKFEFFDRVKRPERVKEVYDQDYINYEQKMIKKSTGPGEDDFEIEQKTEESLVNIDEFINSFADKVGIEAVMKKFEITHDPNLFNQTPGIHADLTMVPDKAEERFKMATSGVDEALSKIDPELVNGQNAEDFVKNLSKEQLDAWIEKKAKLLLEKEGKKHENSKESK